VTRIKRAIAWVALVSALVWPAGHAGSHEEENSIREVKLDQRLGGQLPLDAVFRDETGRPARLDEYFDGKPVLFALVYYECSQLCPLVLDGLARSLRPLGFKANEHYQVVAVSIDPRETPELAREKKRAVMARSEPGAEDGWHLLTADQGSIDRVAQAVGFRYVVNEKAAKDRFVHAIGAMVITPEGKISRYFYGFDYPPRDLRLALIEASGNRIGSPIDQLLLLCYKYDPAKGKYTLAILNVLRVSGVATLVGIGAFVLVMLGRERRNGGRTAAGDPKANA
jgi:protein SCO1/2